LAVSASGKFINSKIGNPHASGGPSTSKETGSMNDCKIHEKHYHVHRPGCGHLGVKHSDHIDYLHDGHLHHMHLGHVCEHALSVDDTNPAACTPKHNCSGHARRHQHGANCGHPAIPHGDHVDYVVNGHLHHPHGTHCDDHGPLFTVT
jgi:hypothetical protein